MEENRGKKHCCKFCNKRFPCGRSLGGHMRSHLSLNPKKFEIKEISSNAETSSKSFDCYDGYVLRENPKKNSRFSDSISASMRKKTCSECGKLFESWKALFGHMKCHEGGGQVSDSQSDNEGPAPMRRRRSARTRPVAQNPPRVMNNSSSVTEIEQEQEDVAISLMMLSRDMASSWFGINSLTDSSSNNSIVMEAPPATKGDLANLADFSLCRYEFGNWSMKIASGKLKSGVTDDEFSVEELGVKAEMEDDVFSDRGVERSVSDEEPLVKTLGSASCAKLMRYSQVRGVFGKAETEVSENLDKRARHESCKTEFGKRALRKIKGVLSDGEMVTSVQGRRKYTCSTCKRTFHSYQALGGHKASHKKVKGCFASKIVSSEESYEDEGSPESVADDKQRREFGDIFVHRGKNRAMSGSHGKKNNHECPICFRVFMSGQALGGHKKCHVNGVTSISQARETSDSQQKMPQVPELLDLNLPAPVEDDNVDYKSWWFGGCGSKPEALVGPIYN